MGYVGMMYGIDLNLEVFKYIVKVFNMMGLIVEMLGCMYGILCEVMDEFGVCLYCLVWEVILEGCWKNEIVFIEGYNEDGFKVLCEIDEVICLEIMAEGLFQLWLVFDFKGGQVMVGILFVLFDGVLLILVMLVECVQVLGFKLWVKICLMVVVGCDVVIMGYGLVLVIQKVLKWVGLIIDDIDYVELNEVFVV